MNNILIAALTLTLVPAICKNTFAEDKSVTTSQMPVSKPNFSAKLIAVEKDQQTVQVDFDYIIDENGKGYVTYIQSQDEVIKNEVIKFIENATYHFSIQPGKIYNMKLSFIR